VDEMKSPFRTGQRLYGKRDQALTGNPIVDINRLNFSPKWLDQFRYEPSEKCQKQVDDEKKIIDEFLLSIRSV
jgi:hypothetical protein